MQPLVSIVIPVYNGANYMREAIDSALAQTYPNIEIIVVNDGSTDNTKEIALSYGERIRYFEKENGGVSTALNLAIREMNGEYFSWLSHDDVYYPDKIKLEMDALRESGNMEQVVYGKYDTWNMMDGSINEVSFFEYEMKYMQSGLFAVLHGKFYGCVLLIPKAYFEKYGLFDTTLIAAQDNMKWFEMVHDKQILYVNHCLIRCRSHATNISKTCGMLFWEENDRCYLKMLKSIKSTSIELLGMDEYIFWGMLLTVFSDHFPRASEYAARKLLEAHSDTKNENNELQDYFLKLDAKNIWVYCCGFLGKSLLKDLLCRNVEVKGIVDTNKNLWGEEVFGFTCQSPEDIPQNATVIVAKYYPEKLFQELKRRKSYNVLLYDMDLRKKIEFSAIRDLSLIKKWYLSDCKRQGY